MKTLQAIALAALASVAAMALAHGDAQHASRRRWDPAKVEETAFGRAGNPAAVDRTVSIDASDSMRFKPDKVSVARGQTVRFVLRNRGHLLHEMVLGTAQALEEHAALMRKFPDMEHAEPNMVHVKPAASGEIVWQFTRAGEFRFACLQPGHYEAGMVGTVVVK